MSGTSQEVSLDDKGKLVEDNVKPEKVNRSNRVEHFSFPPAKLLVLESLNPISLALTNWDYVQPYKSHPSLPGFHPKY